MICFWIFFKDDCAFTCDSCHCLVCVVFLCHLGVIRKGSVSALVKIVGVFEIWLLSRSVLYIFNYAVIMNEFGARL